jgi:hypothetical protein
VFYGTATDLSEAALASVFAQHGEVASLSLVRCGLGMPSGCGHVTMATSAAATAARAALHGSSQGAEAGGSLGVLLVEAAPDGCSSPTTAAQQCGANADPAKMSRTVSQQRTAVVAYAASCCRTLGVGAGRCALALARSPACLLLLTRTHTQAFFTKVPPTVTSQQLTQLFSACGEVGTLELFIPWPGAKISKGCGLVEFTSTKAAAAAVRSLNHKFTWPHSHSALVVEWVDRSRQSATGKVAKAARAAAAAAATTAGGSTATGSSCGKAGPAAADVQQFYRLALHQQQAAAGPNSCPLPQLPPGWQVIGTTSQLPASANVATMRSHLAAQQQQHGCLGGSLTNSSSFALQQAVSPGWSSDSMWTGLPATAGQSGSMASSATFDLSSLAGSGCAYQDSSANSCASNMQHLQGYTQAWDAQQQQHAYLGMAATRGMSSGGMQQQMPAANSSCSGMDAGIWQQLLQQNVMLLQAMNSPVEDEAAAAASMRPPGSAAAAGLFQAASQAQLQASMAMSAATSVAGMPMLLPAASSAQQQQLAMPQSLCQASLGMSSAVVAGVQHLAVASPDARASVVLPLSHAQLGVMAHVLPEVPLLSGAQAYISPCGTGLQLVLSGSPGQLQSAYNAVGMLLSAAGVNEPLPPAMVTGGAV